MSHAPPVYFTSTAFLGKLYLLAIMIPVAFPELIEWIGRTYERLYVAYAVWRIRRQRST